MRRDIRQGVARIRRIDAILADATARLEELRGYGYSHWALRNRFRHIVHMSVTRARHIFAQESVTRDFPNGLPSAEVRMEIIRRRERAFHLFETLDPLTVTREYVRSYLTARPEDHDVKLISKQIQNRSEPREAQQ